MKLRLSHVMDTLPKYSNKFSKGPHKSGNYKGVNIVVYDNNTRHNFDANNFPRELLEAPWYIKEIYPVVTSSYGSHTNAGLYIVMEKGEKDYE